MIESRTSVGNGMGVTGFVTGLLGFLFCLPIITFVVGLPLAICGIVFGALGWRKAVNDPVTPHGGLALAGLILGVLAIIWLVALIVLAGVTS